MWKSSLLCVMAALVAAMGSSAAHARSLAAKLQAMPKSDTGIPTVDVVTPGFIELTARGVDFPATSTTPGFTYTYNPDLNMFERSSASLGPALLERAETVGAGRFDIGVSYLYADLVQKDGDEIEGSSVPYLILPSTGVVEVGRMDFDEFSLKANVWSASATYGLTDSWDVNVLVPVQWTSLEAVGTFPLFPDVAPSVIPEDNRLGVGDILLRTKYRFSADVPINLAGLFTVRLPTGKRTDFRGLGITTLQPALVLSRVHWGHDFHANVGVEVNTSHPDRSLGRYGLGATFRILPYLAGLVDVIGSSGLTDSSTTVTTGNIGNLAFPSVSQLNDLLGGDATIEDVSFTRTPTERRANIAILIPRTDLLDLAVGWKVSIVEGLVGFAQVVIPLNPDGVRANMVPVGGVEYSF